MDDLAKSINDLLVVKNATGVSANEIAVAVRAYLQKRANSERIAAQCSESGWTELRHNTRAETLQEI